MTPRDSVELGDEQTDETPVSVGISEDFGTNAPQITMSLAEAKAMQRMPGGICFTNWMRIRGLLNEDVVES